MCGVSICGVRSHPGEYSESKGQEYIFFQGQGLTPMILDCLLPSVDIYCKK
jgi:hypothetical protein